MSSRGTVDPGRSRTWSRRWQSDVVRQWARRPRRPAAPERPPHRRRAVTGHGRRHALGDRHHPPVDDEAAVVLAGHEGLDDDVAAARLAVRHRERGAYVVLVLQVEADPAAVVAVERLEHDGIADPLRLLAQLRHVDWLRRRQQDVGVAVHGLPGLVCLDASIALFNRFNALL